MTNEERATQAIGDPGIPPYMLHIVVNGRQCPVGHDDRQWFLLTLARRHVYDYQKLVDGAWRERYKPSRFVVTDASGRTVEIFGLTESGAKTV